MFADFLSEELKWCRTETERDVVCSALKGAKTRMRHLQKRLKRHLESGPLTKPATGFVVTERQKNPFYGGALAASR
jgi:hypothetical protein